ncbi:MAG: flagellar hook-associated protein FlgK [Lachnospiraceae bacterium]|nr:flagellar hook-associated protein FlgK [Lachnospiraceae bacterium]
MPSQFFGLNIAYTGLTAANAALNTTGNNISNVETEGYSRQQVTQEAYDALRTFTTYGCAGAGVETIAIERIRDEFYDVKYWNNNANLGEYEVKQYYMETVQNYFKDDETMDGFSTIFEQMSTMLVEVQNNPGDESVKAQFIGYANTLTEYFNGMSGNLTNMQQDVNSEIKVQVNRINSIAQELATLNKQINTVELEGITANELRDKRAVLIDELSQIVDVTTTETPIIDKRTGYPSGANTFVVKIAGGQTLVNTNDYYSLKCVSRTSEQRVNQSDADGLYNIEWSNGLEFDMYGSSTGGKLKGLIQMRDGNNGERFHGTISEIGTTTIDSDIYDTVTIQAEASYLLDLNKCVLSHTGGTINLGNQLFTYSSWEFDSTTNKYTFYLNRSENENIVNASRLGREATVGQSIDYQGIPYYMEQMNEWVRCYAKAFNDILSEGIDAYGKAGTPLFVANHATDEGQYKFTEAEDDVITTTSDSYYLLTAKNFSISSEIIKDTGLLVTSTASIDEESNSDIVDKLIQLKSDISMMSFRGCTASQFLQCVLSDVSLNAQRAETFEKNYMNISSSIDNQRIAISGVDNDEEALNLVKYQNAYELASKMIQTLTEIYDRLILQTGV